MILIFEKIIAAIIVVFSAYIISLDLFFFIGHFFVPVFDDNSSITIKLFVYALVTLNLLSVTFLFFVLTNWNPLKRNKFIFIILTPLFLITVIHLLMVNLQSENNYYDILHAFQPHSIKTLILLVLFAIFLLFKSKNTSQKKD